MELLLYGLGELAPLRYLATAWHLQRCSACRARSAELSAASVHFANALRPPHGVPRPPARVLPAMQLWILALVIVIATVVGVAAIREVSRHNLGNHNQQSDGGCAPGLSSDKCK